MSKYSDDFGLWWKIYPSRGNSSKGPKEKAFIAYQKVIKKHGEKATHHALRKYIISISKRNIIGTSLTKMPVTFLNELHREKRI